jgi:short-subunit dehydrogenase
VARSDIVLATAAAAGVLGLLYLGTSRRRYDWRGKVVVLTGGSRGLGLVMARRLVERGARVAICARDTEELARAEAELVAMGGHVVAVPCDLADAVQIHAMLQRARDALGPIDALVNNAGLMHVGPLECMTLEDFEAAMAVHFWAPLHATLAVIPEMRERGGGRIVNIVSIGGRVAVPHMAPYVASKFALAGLSRALRAELHKDGILVTTVFPGLMRTGSTVHAQFKGQHRREYAWFATGASVPLLSTAAERAAVRILGAAAAGRAELILTPAAKLAAHGFDLLPGFAQAVAALVNRGLPSEGGIGVDGRPGRASDTLPRWLTYLTDQAAVRNNELSPLPEPLP